MSTMDFPISREDVLRGRQGAPGWYLLTIRTLTKGPGKNDPTSNTITVDMVVKDTLLADKAIVGAPVKFYLSDKAPGMAIPFIESVTGKRIPENGATPNIMLSQGKDVRAYLVWDLQFKTWKCQDFMPANGQPAV